MDDAATGKATAENDLVKVVWGGKPLKSEYNNRSGGGYDSSGLFRFGYQTWLPVDGGSTRYLPITAGTGWSDTFQIELTR